jgi:hypothetical protein
MFQETWRWRQYVSPKHWHLPTSLYGAKTQNITILTAVTTILTCSVKNLLVKTSLTNQLMFTMLTKVGFL